MPSVTVGIFRNNLWSLKFNEVVNVLLASLDDIDFSTLQTQIKEFAAHSSFCVGALTIAKHTENQAILTFPGICLTSNNWLVCSHGVQHQMIVDIHDTDLHTLLEFLVHMQHQFKD
jgi:uncharacterized protein YpuA (DUF1002 family)